MDIDGFTELLHLDPEGNNYEICENLYKIGEDVVVVTEAVGSRSWQLR